MNFYLLIFFPDTEVIMTLRHFVCCITRAFPLWR